MTSISPINIQWKSRAQTRLIILHDSHTPASIENGHEYLKFKGRQMGLLDVGYHYIIERDGTVIETRNHEAIGSACPGLNHLSVQLCLLGGLSEDAVFEDNITFDQKVSTMKLLESLTLRYPNAKIKGHDELVKFSSRTHRCPCWSAEDVRQDFKMWLATGVLP